MNIYIYYIIILYTCKCVCVCVLFYILLSQKYNDIMYVCTFPRPQFIKRLPFDHICVSSSIMNYVDIDRGKYLRFWVIISCVSSDELLQLLTKKPKERDIDGYLLGLELGLSEDALESIQKKCKSDKN